MRIGIVGNGYVGKATALLENQQVTCLAYDILPEACQPPDTTLEQVAACEIVFICVPTPMEINGYCHLGIVELTVNKLRELNASVAIVIRSTVPPGTSQRLGVHTMPEFLTEANWEDDFKHTAQWVVGWNQGAEGSDTFKTSLQHLLTVAKTEGSLKHSDIEWVSTTEAETIKYLRNCFLATKVCFFNEMEEFCQNQSIDFETVRRVGTRDPRIGGAHSHVPGPDGLRGFGGRCLTKDLSALCTTIESCGIVPTLLRTVLNRNIHRDRQGVVGAVKSDADIRQELQALSLRELRMMAQQRGMEPEQDTTRQQLEDQLLVAERQPTDRQPPARTPVSTGGPSIFQISPQQERDLQAQHRRRQQQREQQIKAVQNQRQAEAEATGRARPRGAQQAQAPLPPGMTQQQHQMVQQQQRAMVQQQQQMQNMGMRGQGMPGQGMRGQGMMGPGMMGPGMRGGMPAQQPQRPRATGGPVQMGPIFGTTQAQTRPGAGGNTFQFNGGIQNNRR